MDKQEERTAIVTDGAYSGTENAQLAADKNIELITTSLRGKAARDILADFGFNEEGKSLSMSSRSCTEELFLYEAKQSVCQLSISGSMQAEDF